MNDLFRFLLLRPAMPTAPDAVKALSPSFVKEGTVLSKAKQAASQFVTAGKMSSAEQLGFAAAVDAAAIAIGTGSMSAGDLDKLLKKVAGKTAAQIANDAQFSGEEQRVADTLCAMKLLSGSQGGDAPGLARLAQGYDAIKRAVGGADPVGLRVLALASFPPDAAKPNNPPQPPSPPSLPTPVNRNEIANLETAINTLTQIPVSAFRVAVPQRTKDPKATQKGDKRSATAATAAPATPANIFTNVGQAWMLSDAAIKGLPATAQKALAGAGVDLTLRPLPQAINTLQDRKMMLLKAAYLEDLRSPLTHFKIGNSFAPIATNDYVGQPATGLPTGRGSIRPVGIGDLLLVKEHVLRYEGGDLAHVENVLKSEHLSRDTRRLERTETTVLQETETTKEEEQDTQTTDRFSLQRETSDTINSEFSLKAGLSVDAKYGPMVEVKANTDLATSVSDQSSTKQASDFSKDVVARSVSKLTERVLERRTTTTITEFEEKYSHGFDNTNGAGNISGFYQWINKVTQAQVYNYGKRLLFDVMVPEPGTNFILMQTKAVNQAQSLTKPVPFTLKADEITEANYTIWGALYEVTGMDPPPPIIKTISKAYDSTMNQDPHEGSKSDTLTIDDGYTASYALFQENVIYWNNAMGAVLIGANYVDLMNPIGYMHMSGEIDSVAISYSAYQMEQIAVNIEIFCQRTARAFAAWQLKVHAAITQGFQAKEQAYEEALAQAQAAAGVVVSGRNPEFNSRLVTGELRKQCLTLITAQQFDAFGALELSSQGFAQPNLARSADQMPYVRFFEQAFEWEHIIYFYYPYFWGWKDAWQKHVLLDDVDPDFADFLRAGAARVVFPVRPGFEAAIIHYLDTGEIWNGGPPPDISSSLYVSIVQEIQEATGAPGNEVPVGDPWLIHLPTTLVQLRPNNDLPEWKKVGEDWEPAN
jgi:hypothetical protein